MVRENNTRRGIYKKMSKTILSMYGSHNASVSLLYDGNIEVVEVERWVNSKNVGLTSYLVCKSAQIVFNEICDYLLEKCDHKVDIFLHNHLGNLVPNFEYVEKLDYDHHISHASGAFYQSNYSEAIVFTFDGGGDNGFFNVYNCNRQGDITLLEKFDQDLGFAYMLLGDYLDDINKDPLNIGNLVYAGKLMGLCAYGNIRTDWVEAFNIYYEKFNYVGNSFLGGAETAPSALKELMTSIGVDFEYNVTRISGQVAWDIAATTQFVFEEQFYKFALPYIKDTGLPICLSGGCALNVLLNARLLKELDGNLFIPPNPSDAGISVGGLLWKMKPSVQIDLTYAGLPILDAQMLGTYLNEYNYIVLDDVSIETVATMLNDDYIIGVLNGNSEHGPRALGNRSILCKPTTSMKDVINKKVKNREWYRPFAPVVRDVDVSKYFNFFNSSRHMTHVADIREEYRDILGAVTHADGTGRLQTVSIHDNLFLYKILTSFANINGCGVLLNTSFNVDKKPILSTLADAFKILHETELDAIYYDNKIICKEHQSLANNIAKYE